MINSAKPGNNFESLPAPTRKDQLWRFSNVDLLDLAPFKYGDTLTEQGARRTILEQSRGLEEVAGRMIFAGDQLIERDVISDQLKKRGVIFQPLERAMVEHADVVPKTFHVATGSAWICQVRRAAPGVGFVRDISLRAARRRD